MDYLEYKTASERHLETCLKLRDLIQMNYSSGNLNAEDEMKRDRLLANIYYLSGYVIECIVNYGILKTIKYDVIASKFNLKSVRKLTTFYQADSKNKFAVSFDENDQYSLWPLYRKGHKFQQNLKFFTFPGGANLSGMNITAIDIDPQEPVKSLLKNWDVECRYIFGPKYSINNQEIILFLKLAEEIHWGIRKQITKD